MADSSSSFFNSKLRHEVTAVVKTIVNMLANLTLWFYQTPYCFGFFRFIVTVGGTLTKFGFCHKFDNIRNVNQVIRRMNPTEIKKRFFHLINREYYTLARRYEFYVLVARAISHSFAALTCEILFLSLEHKIHIFSPPCNILYLFFFHVTIPQ